MSYNINDIVPTVFSFDELSEYPDLRKSLIGLMNPDKEKLKNTRELIDSVSLPWHIRHHIKIRLELLDDLI